MQRQRVTATLLAQKPGQRIGGDRQITAAKRIDFQSPASQKVDAHLKFVRVTLNRQVMEYLFHTMFVKAFV